MASPEPTFTCSEISAVLVEVIAEKEREPTTSIWASFWDRITNGGERPAFINVPPVDDNTRWPSDRPAD